MKLNGAEQKRLCSILGRPPTLTEETIFAIQWSEHCSYKSSKRFLRKLPTESPHVILGPGQDSGIVAITDTPIGKRWGLVISHESHNHPSQIVPYEGAATGIGGVVRDVLCMGARVIGCLDMLCFGDGKTELSRTIIRDVIRGIGGYGNPIGVPNLGGSTLFNQRYNKNCLVNAVAIGLVREDHIIPSIVPKDAARSGYDIILVGKATDASGFGGAAFASASLLEKEEAQNRSAVQEPNPFLERHLLAAFYDLFEWLQKEEHINKVSCKDLGAGGVVCATVEQVAARGLGAKIELTNVHTIPNPLPPEVIACAETQERMCLICYPDLTDFILQHFNNTWDIPSIAENARASVIGKVTDDGIYHLTYKGKTVCKAKSVDITCGVEYTEKERPITPRYVPSIPLDTPGVSSRVFSRSENVSRDTPGTRGDTLVDLLNNPNNASKEPIFMHFDKSVIGNTFLEPGEADASVIAPLQDQGNWTGVALACGGSMHTDPFAQASHAATQAIAKVIATGATPRALTDCLNYGNPEKPEQLFRLAEGVQGLVESANRFSIPFVSGNVSLYNCADDGSSIPPTATVCCVGVFSDARKALSAQFKKAGSRIALVQSRDLCHLLSFLPTLIEEEQVSSAHSITKGILMALIEMTIPIRGSQKIIGLEIDCAALSSLLWESTSGILLELPLDLDHSQLLPIGRTHIDPVLTLTDNTKTLLSLPLPPIHQKWKNGITDTIFAAK